MVAVNVITMPSGQVRELTYSKLMLSANVNIPSDNVIGWCEYTQ